MYIREYLRGKYHCTVDLQFDLFGISHVTTDNLCFNSQNRLIQISQTGGQWYNDLSPFSIPCLFPFIAIWSIEIWPTVIKVKIVGTCHILGTHISVPKSLKVVENGWSDIWLNWSWNSSWRRRYNTKETRAQCYKTFFVRNLHFFIISWSVCPWQAFPA
jgi:hypothetical protein